MKRRQFVQHVGAAALALQAGHEALAFAPERKTMPLDAFVDGPLISSALLSPDGKRLAMIVNSGDKTQVITRDLATGALQAALQTDNLEYFVNWIRWKTNDRLLASLLYPTIRDLGMYNRRVETLESRLIAINTDGSRTVNMVKTRRDFGQQMKWSFAQDQVIDFLPDDPDHVVMILPDGDQSRAGNAAFKVNIHTAERSLHQAPHENAYFVCTDAKHQVRVAMEGNGYNAATTLWVCDPDGSHWRKLAVNKGPFDENSISPMAFGLDPNILYVGARVNGLMAIHTMDLREEQPSLTLKLADPTLNLSALIRDPRGEIVGASASDSGTGSSRFYWDQGYKDLQEQIDLALPNRWNRVMDVSRNGGRYLISSTVPGLPGSLMVGSLTTGRLESLGSFYPDLDPQRIARKRPFSFKARDGFELHAFLTLPLGSKPDNLPLVAFPHGGPQSHDTERFDEMVAFMADRGYAVLQVNFRGSTGYGWDYMKAGLRRAGLETQDDVTDGVKKLVADGVADPARLAIVGWSFGGYAALNGVVKDPELYRGAFAIAPVSNLIDAVSNWRSWGGRESVRTQIGDARDDADQLRATSPVFHADRIRVPVVLVHGKLDRQAEFDQSVQMDAALTKAGKDHKFIAFDKGDHSLTHRPYRRKLYEELEAFLKSTLGPAA